MAYPYPISPLTTDADTGGFYRPQNIFVRGADLYFLGAHYSALALPEEANMHMFKSSDAGATWAEVNAAGAPLFLRSQNFSSYQGMPSSLRGKLKTGSTTLILIPYCRKNGAIYGELCFVEFNMATDTWGVPVTGGPIVLGVDASDNSVREVVAVYRPGTNDYLFAYLARRGVAFGPPQSYAPIYSDAVVYAGGWGVPWQLAGAPVDQNYFIRDMVHEPVSGRTHCFIAYWHIDASPPTTGGIELYHRTIRPDNTMTALALAASGLGFYIFASTVGSAILTAGGHIAIPFLRNNPIPPQSNQPWPQSMALAVEAESPVWTAYDVSAVTTSQVTTGLVGVGGWQIAYDGTNIVGYWSNPGGLTKAIQTATFNIGTLSWGAVSDAYLHPTIRFGDFLTIVPGSTNVVATDREALPGNNYTLSFWQFGAGPPPPPATTNPTAATSGFRTPPCPTPNCWDLALRTWAAIWSRAGIRDLSLCVVRHELPNGVQMPDGAVEFYESSSILTPTTVSGDNTVLDFRVPMGYYGMLYGLCLHYTGTGFVDGSGDIIWRVRVGNAWAAPGLGSVNVALGVPSQCLQLTDYIRLISGQRIRAIVNVPNTSGLIQIGTSRIVCTLQGWYYPV